MRLFILLTILLSKITPQYFLDITDESGTEVSRHQSSFFGAGVTMVDFDHDGYDDIIVPTPDGSPFRVFKNLGDETFVDIAESIGFENEDSESSSPKPMDSATLKNVSSPMFLKTLKAPPSGVGTIISS